ncbi:MAG: LysR family transcriptional regulator [Candidatus Cellulosilyticum pullistercoris]|uniref:LysR family transcriptional regulator n=1 Tax=Candidatus Cellulosilyticum pullistercoris TaxID=2838521 RepID=A0A9E2KC63_9FIRM|nr:LysR family transcriptional regulator [Candidatus Cellulosilyticum pullistercoris]
MDFKQLSYFVATVQEGNISKAAIKLNISQPPLSTKLKELENELGVTLFERGSRKIELTQAGHMLYARATSILELIDISKKELADYTSGKIGTLRIGIISSIGSTLINDWLTHFHQIYPDILFNVFEGNTYEQLDKLRSNLIELAIVRTPFSADDLECTLLMKEQVYAVGHDKYFEGLHNSYVSLSQICDKPLILYRRWQKFVKNFCMEEGLNPYIFCMNDDARTTASMANSGLGIGIIPESTLPLLSAPHMVQKAISDHGFNSNICLLRNPNSYHSTVVNLFYEFLEDYIK